MSNKSKSQPQNHLICENKLMIIITYNEDSNTAKLTLLQCNKNFKQHVHVLNCTK